MGGVLKKCAIFYKKLRGKYSEVLVSIFELKHGIESNDQLCKAVCRVALTPIIPSTVSCADGNRDQPKVITFDKISRKVKAIMKDFEEISEKYFECNYDQLFKETLDRISYINHPRKNLCSSVDSSEAIPKGETWCYFWMFLGLFTLIMALFVSLYFHRIHLLELKKLEIK
jgi:hypothetical protein